MTPYEILQELLTEASRHPGVSSPYINPKIINFIKTHFPSHKMLEDPALLEKYIAELPSEKGFRKISDIVDLLKLSPKEKESLYHREGEPKDVVLRGIDGQPLVYDDGSLAQEIQPFMITKLGIQGPSADLFQQFTPEQRLLWLKDHPEVMGVNKDILDKSLRREHFIPEAEEKARKSFMSERKIIEDASKFAKEKLRYNPGEAEIIPPSRGALREDVHEQLHNLKNEIKRAGITSAQLSRREPSKNSELQQKAEKFINTHNVPIHLEDLGSDRPAPVFSETFPVRKTAEGYPVANQEFSRIGPREPVQASEESSGRLQKRPTESEGLAGIEDMDVQMTHIPKYQQQAAREALEMLRDVAHEPHLPYPSHKQRLAPPSSEQDIAREKIAKMAKENPLSPHYTKARKMLDEVGRSDLANKFEGERQRGSSPVTSEELIRHYDPYKRDVINAFKEEALEDFTNKILRPLEGQLIGSGQFHTGARGRALQEARRDLQRVGSREIARLQSAGFEKAREAALAEKKMALEGMTRGADLAERDTQNRLEAASRLQRGAQEENADELKNILTAAHLGGQSQAHEQEKLNMQIADFNAQKQDKVNKAAQLMAGARGMPVPTAVMSSQPQIQQGPMVPNTLTQLGGLATGLGGMMMKGGPHQAAHGGRIHKAPGGSLISQALKDIRDQSLQDSLTRAQELDKPGQNPWGDFLMHTGFGMAASQNPRPLGALAEGAMHGAQAFERGHKHNEERRNQAINIRKAIADSLRAEEALAHERSRTEADDLYKAAKTKHLNWEMEGGKKPAGTGQNLKALQDMMKSGQVAHVDEALQELPSPKLSVGEQKQIFDAHQIALMAPDIIENLKEAQKYNKEAAPLLGEIRGDQRKLIALEAAFSDTKAKQLEARQSLEKTAGNVLAAESELAKKISIPLTKIRGTGMYDIKKMAPVNDGIIKRKLEWWVKNGTASKIEASYGEKLGPLATKRLVANYISTAYDPKSQKFNESFEEFMGWTRKRDKEAEEIGLDEGEVDDKFPDLEASSENPAKSSGNSYRNNSLLRAAQILKSRGLKVKNG